MESTKEQTMEGRGRLVRSKSNRIISGVCGGLAKYFDVDATWVRIGFLILGLASGVGVVLYLVLAVLIPAEGRDDEPPAQVVQEGARELAEKAQRMGSRVAAGVQQVGSGARHHGAFVLGCLLMALGGFFLLHNLDIDWPWFLSARVWWPVVLILVGSLLFWRHLRGSRS